MGLGEIHTYMQIVAASRNIIIPNNMKSQPLSDLKEIILLKTEDFKGSLIVKCLCINMMGMGVIHTFHTTQVALLTLA